MSCVNFSWLQVVKGCPDVMVHSETSGICLVFDEDAVTSYCWREHC